MFCVKFDPDHKKLKLIAKFNKLFIFNKKKSKYNSLNNSMYISYSIASCFIVSLLVSTSASVSSSLFSLTQSKSPRNASSVAVVVT